MVLWVWGGVDFKEADIFQNFKTVGNCLEKTSGVQNNVPESKKETTEQRVYEGTKKQINLEYMDC